MRIFSIPMCGAKSFYPTTSKRNFFLQITNLDENILLWGTFLAELVNVCTVGIHFWK
jgi:hypothetical protein